MQLWSEGLCSSDSAPVIIRNMGEGRKSLVGTFALSLVLTFFVESPVKLEWGGLSIAEKYVWIYLLIAHSYFCVMAYTKGVFSGVARGGTTWRAFLAEQDQRQARVGMALGTYGATLLAILTWVLILLGVTRSF